MLQRPRRVDRHVAALIRREGIRHVVDDNVDALCIVIDGCDVVEIGRDSGEGNRRARGEIVNDLDHHRAFLPAIQTAGAECSGVAEFGRFAGLLGLLQPDDAIGDDRDAYA